MKAKTVSKDFPAKDVPCDACKKAIRAGQKIYDLTGFGGPYACSEKCVESLHEQEYRRRKQDGWRQVLSQFV